MSPQRQSVNFLIIDDEESILESLCGVFTDEGYRVRTASSGEQGLQMLEQEPAEIVFLDIWLPGIDGIETFRRIKAMQQLTAVIMISGHGSIETAVEATKLGAYYFIEKPIDLEKILIIARRALESVSLERENISLRKKIEERYEMIGDSPAIRQIQSHIMAAAPTNGRVLISGENGTGKELVARAIHNESKRKAKSFVEVNCAAIPEDLIESELFGHEKGSFTGATARKIGKFELADGGTLFLDEVGDMSLKTQAKVLRVLEQQKIERVGGQDTIPVDVRLIAASNKDLEAEISAGTFREDLFYRLNVIPIVVPPLRERITDIPVLCDYYLDFFCRENKKKRKTLTSKAIGELQAYPWPGNIRELRNIIERLVIMVAHDDIDVGDIPSAYRRRFPQPESEDTTTLIERGDSLRQARDRFERQFIIDCLEKNDWNISRTAEILKIERTNLHRKMKLLDIQSGRVTESGSTPQSP